MFSRRAFLASTLAAGATPVMAVDVAVRPPPRPAIPSVRPPAEPLDVGALTEALVSEAGLGGSVSLMVLDARTGQVKVARNPDLALPPASTAKALTAAYAFDNLGPGMRFGTRLYATAPVRNGRLDGDLILAGGGDPGLDSGHLSLLAKGLDEAGVREVTGRFLVWDQALPYVREIDPGQPDHLAYNPSISGLNLNYNRVYLDWQPTGSGYVLKLDARAGKIIPPVGRVRARAVERSAPIFEHIDTTQPEGELWTVSRRALGGKGARWLPVRQSTAYTAEVFATLARTKGIDLPPPEAATSAPRGILLTQQFSSPVRSIAVGMLRHSTNLTAEVLGLAATQARTGTQPADLAASAAEMNAWARETLGMQEPGLVDHSGLSGTSLLTTRDMANGLRRIGPDSVLAATMREIGLNNEDGRPEPLTLRAKTGTLNFVSALAGYIAPKNGRELIFAIQTAELERRAAIPLGQEENPPGTRSWTRRSRKLQYDLVRLWARAAATA